MSVRPRILPSFGEACALAIVLAFQWSIARGLQNGAFVDEATYIVAGRLLRAAAAVPAAFAGYFSGAPVLYPRLAAWADAIGGLEGARRVSLVSMWVATGALFVTTRSLFSDGVSAVVGAALFALAAPTLFLARFATYDAPSLALLGCALAVAACAPAAARHGSRVTLGALAGVLAGLAVATKYAALLYIPAVFATIALIPAPCPPGRRDGVLVAWGSGVLATLLGVTFANGVMATVHGFFSTTVTRAAPSGGSAADILSLAAVLGGAVTLLALPAPLLARGTLRQVLVVLLVSALLAPLNHVRLHEMVSLQKHVAFGILLVAPLAGATLGWVLAWAREAFERGRRIYGSVTYIATLLAAFRFAVMPAQAAADRLFTYWPQRTPDVYALLRPVAMRGAHLLDEEPDLGLYYLGAATTYGQWTHPYYFRYPGATRDTLTGRGAYVQALRDGYFDAVVLRYGPQREWARVIEGELLDEQPRYRLAGRFPFTLADGDGMYEVWVRSDAPGADEVR